MGRVVGQITRQECDELEALHYRYVTFQTILRSMLEPDHPTNEVLYQRVVNDMAATRAQLDAWFEDKSCQYEWLKEPGMEWHVDFRSCMVSLAPGERTVERRRKDTSLS